MKSIRAAWQYAVTWFEQGDLVPLMVVISAVHYAAVLAAKDSWPVAIAIGLLVDLGHYRTVRAAVRYAGASKAQGAARWLIASGMTALSLSYHQRYYADWWLSAPLPLLIAALAWLQQIERRSVSGPKADSAARPAETAPVEQTPSIGEREYLCSCGYRASSQAALNGHKRRHSSRPLLKSAQKQKASEN